MKTVETVAERCFGCGSCYSVCPQNAINMTLKNGFLYPSIDNSCISCGKCLKICPAENNVPGNEANSSMVLFAKDHDIYDKSSSGGFFGVVAHYFIKEKNGIVIGAALVDDCKVEHIIVSDEYEINRLQGSKYVQSNTQYIYDYIVNALENNKAVLFCGTPCQVAALRLRFPNEEKLFLIDIVCHGVPSPELFREHVTKNILTDEKIERVLFRTKDKYDRYGFNLVVEGNKSRKWISGLEDPYYRLFLKDASFRDSCYSCPFANRERLGDITISDCNNSGRYLDFFPDKTLSTIYLVSQKGIDLFKVLKNEFNIKMADLEYEASANAQMNHPSKRPIFRNKLYPCNAEQLSEYVNNNLGKVNLKTRVKVRLKRIIPEKQRIWMVKNVKKVLKK